MVSGGRLAVLDLKLLRDVWRIKGQALAIALVQASGISLLVMSLGMVAALDETMNAYYDRYRFADVFASATRAPELVLEELRVIDGVSAVEGRAIGAGLVDIEGVDAPITAQFVSRPSDAAAPLNDVHIVRGRAPDPARTDEVLLLQAFADAHGLEPGDRLTVTVYGARRVFLIAGVALSPEYIYAIAPGAPVVDDDRFAVVWGPYEALAPAFNLDGAFNEAVFRLSRGVDPASVIPEIDRVLEPYGGRGAYDRGDQVSNRYLTEELRQFETMAFVMTPIFMLVTVFLLNVVISRMVQTEREQIGLLKAFGYTGKEIGSHYGKFALLIAIAGAGVGWLGGLYLGRVITQIFQEYYHFPFLIFQTDFRTIAYALGLSGLGAGLGAFGAVRAAIALQPAEAMRPPAPEFFRGANRISSGVVESLDRPTRMIIRRIARRLFRSLALVFGIAAAMGLSVMMQLNHAAINHILYASFEVIDRSDVTVRFPEALDDKAALELATLDGVTHVEPFRSAAVTFANGRKEYLGAVTGVVPSPRLNRILDEELRPVPVPEQGLLLSAPLAKLLSVDVGDELEVRFREGRRPTLLIEITGLMDALIGTPAYLSLDDLNARLSEPGRISGAYLSVRPDALKALQRKTKEIPQLAGVSVREDVVANFEDLLSQGPGTFRFIMTFFATVIAIGVVYNGARITFGERRHDLASLRILGFTKAESGYVVTGEILLLSIAALPFGSLIGVALWRYLSSALSTELYKVPAVYDPAGFGIAGFTVVLAAIVAAFLIQHDVDKLDMASALKARD